MAKHDRRKTSSQPPSSRPVTIQVPLPVLGVVNGVREAFHGLCIATGLHVLEAMMEADRQVLCGPKGRHQVERPAWRGGSVGSQVTLGGRQIELPRLRVRSAAGEVPLASFQWAAATDPLDEHTLAAVAAGVSTRRYAGTLDPVPADVTERATSSSAVSRRFVALSTKRLQAFLGRPLGELDLRAVCIDGKVFRDHCMVIALGIDTQGRKHVLGLREGATETAAVTTGLLSDLVTRGLPSDRTLLFVIDGAQGLRRAITDVFGSRGVVQRCQVHKWRNVIGHLPERLHTSVGKALRDAWNLDSADRAKRVFERLAKSLEHDHPGAAASIREGLDETLTLQRLGLTGALQRTLPTTNIIENLNGSVEHYTRNVKRWRGGQVVGQGDAQPFGGEPIPLAVRKSSSDIPRNGATASRSSRLRKPAGSRSKRSSAASSACTRGSPKRRVEARWPLTCAGRCNAASVSAPMVQSWLRRSTPSRRRLAAKPICFRSMRPQPPPRAQRSSTAKRTTSSVPATHFSQPRTSSASSAQRSASIGARTSHLNL